MSDDYVEWMKERDKLRFAQQSLAPPLGLCPESVAWSVQNHKRIGEILAAMTRYHADNKPFPLEWVEWLKQRVESQYRT